MEPLKFHSKYVTHTVEQVVVNCIIRNCGDVHIYECVVYNQVIYTELSLVIQLKVYIARAYCCWKLWLSKSHSTLLLIFFLRKPWWRHQMETFSALLALCAGNSPVPVNSPHKGQWRGALMFSLICPRLNDWVNNRRLVIWDAIVVILTSV